MKINRCCAYSLSNVFRVRSFGNHGAILFVCQDAFQERKISSLFNRVGFDKDHVSFAGSLKIAHVDIYGDSRDRTVLAHQGYGGNYLQFEDLMILKRKGKGESNRTSTAVAVNPP